MDRSEAQPVAFPVLARRARLISSYITERFGGIARLRASLSEAQRIDALSTTDVSLLSESQYCYRRYVDAACASERARGRDTLSLYYTHVAASWHRRRLIRQRVLAPVLLEIERLRDLPSSNKLVISASNESAQPHPGYQGENSTLLDTDWLVVSPSRVVGAIAAAGLLPRYRGLKRSEAVDLALDEASLIAAAIVSHAIEARVCLAVLWEDGAAMFDPTAHAAEAAALGYLVIPWRLDSDKSAAVREATQAGRAASEVVELPPDPSFEPAAEGMSLDF